MTDDSTTQIDQPEEHDEEPRRRRTRLLPCPLRSDELITFGDKIDQLISEIEDLEAEKKSAASDFKARIDRRTEELQKVSKQRRSRVIDREVEIEIEQDLAHAEETVRRLDTGEVVSKRTLSSREVDALRQVTVPGTEGEEQDQAEEQDPWFNLPAELDELRHVLETGEGIEDVLTDHLRALVTYAKEKGISPDEPRIKRVTSELASRKRAERKARGL